MTFVFITGIVVCFVLLAGAIDLRLRERRAQQREIDRRLRRIRR